MAEVDRVALDSWYGYFKKFIYDITGEEFSGFSHSYLEENENYKNAIRKAALETLGATKWTEAQIGSGDIRQQVQSALNVRTSFNGKPEGNNLVDWRSAEIKGRIKDMGRAKYLGPFEQGVLNLFQSRSSDEDAFNSISQILLYDSVACLFFFKDSSKYMPIRVTRFDYIFKLLGVRDFKATRNISWNNYLRYNSLVEEVRAFLAKELPSNKVTLLDAHSFLWIVGGVLQDYLDGKLKDKEYPYDGKYSEGHSKLRSHLIKERNRKLVADAKALWLKADPKLRCEACGFSFVEQYGKVGKGFIEAHHLQPLSKFDSSQKMMIKDLAPLCSNCHRMIHRDKESMTIAELKSKLRGK